MGVGGRAEVIPQGVVREGFTEEEAFMKDS